MVQDEERLNSSRKIVLKSIDSLRTNTKKLVEEDKEHIICISKILPKTCNCSKLLIVDDAECNLFVLQNYLKCVGFRADEVFSLLLIN